MTQKLNLSEITKRNKELIKKFKIEQNKLSNQFEDIFEEEMIQLMNKLPSIKALVWTQTTKWEGGMTFDFQVNEIAFLSFELPPTDIHKYPSNYDLPTKEDFVIYSDYSLKESSLTKEEKEICTQIFEVFEENQKSLENLYGENIAGYITKNGVYIYDYED